MEHLCKYPQGYRNATQLQLLDITIEHCQKDRLVDAHGGVFNAFKQNLLCTVTPELDIDCEIAWCKLCIIECKRCFILALFIVPQKKLILNTLQDTACLQYIYNLYGTTNRGHLKQTGVIVMYLTKAFDN